MLHAHARTKSRSSCHCGKCDATTNLSRRTRCRVPLRVQCGHVAHAITTTLFEMDVAGEHLQLACVCCASLRSVTQSSLHSFWRLLHISSTVTTGSRHFPRESFGGCDSQKPYDIAHTKYGIIGISRLDLCMSIIMMIVDAQNNNIIINLLEYMCMTT